MVKGDRGIFVFTVGTFFILPRIPLDDDIESFWDKKSESYRQFQDWQDEFGNDRFIIVAFSDEDIFTQKNLQLISRLSEAFLDLKYVRHVTSLTTLNDIVGDEDNFIVERLIKN